MNPVVWGRDRKSDTDTAVSVSCLCIQVDQSEKSEFHGSTCPALLAGHVTDLQEINRIDGCSRPNAHTVESSFYFLLFRGLVKPPKSAVRS